MYVFLLLIRLIIVSITFYTWTSEKTSADTEITTGPTQLPLEQDTKQFFFFYSLKYPYWSVPFTMVWSGVLLAECLSQCFRQLPCSHGLDSKFCRLMYLYLAGENESHLPQVIYSVNIFDKFTTSQPSSLALGIKNNWDNSCLWRVYNLFKKSKWNIFRRDFRF